MKSQNLLILVVAVLIIGGAGFALSQQGKQAVSDDSEMMTKDEASMDDTKNDVMTKKDDMEAKEDDTINEDSMTKDAIADDAVMMKGSYEIYSPEKLARAETGKVVLFFKATWCPTCRALDSDITKNLTNIPDGVSILELNYDTETELRKKYGVTVQHTLVQVNAAGEQITKWSGGNTLASVLSRLQ